MILIVIFVIITLVVVLQFYHQQYSRELLYFKMYKYFRFPLNTL